MAGACSVARAIPTAPMHSTARRGERGPVIVHALDVTDLGGVDRLASALGGEAIDLLLNNAGVLGRLAAGVRQDRLRGVAGGAAGEPPRADEDDRGFIDHVARSERKLVVTVSSRMGSITEAPGGAYLYRSSKAAVNAVTRNLARDLERPGNRGGRPSGLGADRHGWQERGFEYDRERHRPARGDRRAWPRRFGPLSQLRRKRNSLVAGRAATSRIPAAAFK